MTTNNRQAWNINLIFILMIFFFTGATLISHKRTFSETENRTLAQFPDPDPSDIFSGKFESDYETYLTDQFVMRDRWISLRTLAERAMLHREVHDVYLAKDNYLIEKHTGTFTSDQAQMNRDFLADFIGSRLGRFGSAHLNVLLIPNAVSILEDKLPLLAAPYDENEYLQSIRDVLPDGVWFDAGEVLSRHAQEDIYYRTDHHWKTLGAYYVFRDWALSRGLPVSDSDMTAIPASGVITDASSNEPTGRIDDMTIRILSEDFEGTVASRIGMTGITDSIEYLDWDFPPEYVLTYNRSDDVRSSYLQTYKLEGKDKYAVFFGGNYPLIQAETNAGTGKRILVIKDSYANCFVPFLLRYYDQVDLVDLRYYYDSLSDLIDAGSYTDILFLENASGFAEDTSLSRLSQ